MADDRTHLTPASEAWMSGRPASAAVKAGDLVFLSGQASVTDDGQVRDAGDPEAQARNAFARVRGVLEAAGAGIDDVLDVMTFHKDPRTMDAAFASGPRGVLRPLPGLDRARHGRRPRPRPRGRGAGGRPRRRGREAGRDARRFGWMEGLPVSAACRKGDYLFTSGIVAADDGGNGGGARRPHGAGAFLLRPAQGRDAGGWAAHSTISST